MWTVIFINHFEADILNIVYTMYFLAWYVVQAFTKYNIKLVINILSLKDRSEVECHDTEVKALCEKSAYQVYALC